MNIILKCTVCGAEITEYDRLSKRYCKECAKIVKNSQCIHYYDSRRKKK